MKISIIIPAYNAEKTINSCIDSVICQTYDNLEIIIINDGSKDNTLQICKSYAAKDLRIKLIDNINSGVSYSRNCGIKLATGDYITFVDADDYLDLDCFEKLIKYLNKDVDFLRYNFKLDGPEVHNSNMYDLTNKEIVFNSINRNTVFNHFFTMKESIPNLVMLLIIRYDLANKIFFNEKLTMMEDVDFYLQLFLISNKGYFADEKLYNYYVNPSSVTKNAANYHKNIFGILNTNESIIFRIKSYVDLEFLNKIKANSLNLITNYLTKSFFYKKTYYKEIVFDLNRDERFKNLLEYTNQVSSKNKILLNILKKDIKMFDIIYLNILKILYKIKNILKI